jgi:hypothetical protein
MNEEAIEFSEIIYLRLKELGLSALSPCGRGDQIEFIDRSA